MPDNNVNNNGGKKEKINKININNKDNDNNNDINDDTMNDNLSKISTLAQSKTLFPKNISLINKFENKKEEKKKESKNKIINLDNNIDIEKEDDEPIFTNIDNNLDLEDYNSINFNKSKQLLLKFKDKIKTKYEDYKNKYRRKTENTTIKQKINLIEEELKDKTISSNFQIQALRSVCSWSIGLTTTEHSILEGYFKLIDRLF